MFSTWQWEKFCLNYVIMVQVLEGDVWIQILKLNAPLCGAVSSNNLGKVICKPVFQPGMFSNP
jgi:hypothetical protein